MLLSKPHHKKAGRRFHEQDRVHQNDGVAAAAGCRICRLQHPKRRNEMAWRRRAQGHAAMRGACKAQCRRGCAQRRDPVWTKRYCGAGNAHGSQEGRLSGLSHRPYLPGGTFRTIGRRGEKPAAIPHDTGAPSPASKRAVSAPASNKRVCGMRLRRHGQREVYPISLRRRPGKARPFPPRRHGRWGPQV